MEEYNDLDMVVCKRSGNMIETTINHGIVVIDTDSEFDARNFRKNRFVRNLIDRIQMKEASPLFFMDDDNKVISLSMDLIVVPAVARVSKVCKEHSTKLNQQAQRLPLQVMIGKQVLRVMSKERKCCHL